MDNSSPKYVHQGSVKLLSASLCVCVCTRARVHAYVCVFYPVLFVILQDQDNKFK